MKIAFPAPLPQQRDDLLRLAERIDADDVAAIGEQGDRRQELVDLRPVVGMAEHRKAEGCLGDEGVAGDRLEGRASGIVGPLVVAGDHDPAPRYSSTTWAEPSTWPAGESQTVTSPISIRSRNESPRRLRPAWSPRRASMIAMVSGVARTVSWPGLAWSAWPWLTTAVETDRTGST